MESTAKKLRRRKVIQDACRSLEQAQLAGLVRTGWATALVNAVRALADEVLAGFEG
jgi:hypothetical protein